MTNYEQEYLQLTGGMGRFIESYCTNAAVRRRGCIEIPE